MRDAGIGTGIMKLATTTLAVAWTILVASRGLSARNPQMQGEMKNLTRSIAANELALSQFTWQEQQTIGTKSNVQNQRLFQVQPGSDGKTERYLSSLETLPPGSVGFVGGLTEEFDNYADQVADLAHIYAHLEPGRIKQLYQQGGVVISSGDAPNTVRVTIRNYERQGDSVALIFDTTQKAIQNMEISSYLNDPGDEVKISAKYAPLPNGPNHLSQMVINGEGKQVVVQIQTFNYQRMFPPWR
jgi:hypothetical protein